MWTCSFYHPQVLWSEYIFICIPQSLLPVAAVNPYHLITCLCIQSNEDPECWEPLELLNSEKKLSFCTHPKLKILSVVYDFFTAKKETRQSPTGLEWWCMSCFSIASKRCEEHLPSCWVRPLCYRFPIPIAMFLSPWFQFLCPAMWFVTSLNLWDSTG